jgi:hypothetical protein
MATKKKTKRVSRLQRYAQHKGYWFVLAFALVGGWLVYASYAAVPVNYSVIVVAGQSNADGAESYVLDPPNNFDLFGAKGHPADSSTKLIWSNLVKNSGPPPVTLKSIGDASTKYGSGQATFGPEVGLARGLYDQGRRNVLILKVSFGGLSLAQKDGQDWNVNSSNEAYAVLVNRMKETKSWVASQGGSASVDGFYWVQGEGDANTASAAQYETNLRNLVSRSRTDLGMSSQAPFVIAKTSIAAWIQTAKNLSSVNPCGTASCDQVAQADNTVRAAQQKVADTVPNTKIVDTLNLPRHGFMIHLSNQGELQLGALFAQASAGTPVPNQAAPTPAPAASAAKGTSPSKPAAGTSGSGAAASDNPTQPYADPIQALNDKPATGSIKVVKKSVPWWKRIQNFFGERFSHIKDYISS